MRAHKWTSSQSAELMTSPRGGSACCSLLERVVLYLHLPSPRFTQRLLPRSQLDQRPSPSNAVFPEMAPLLSFHRQIIEEIAPPEHDDLLILAKGLGLRKILCTMMKIYDSEHNLILLVHSP